MKRSAISFLLLLSALASRADNFTKGNEQKPLTPELKTGDYVWKPEVSPAGPVVIIVSLPDQTLHVYRNGLRIGRSTISSGKDGHRTPTGVFTILEKNVTHSSSIYKGASMPYQERLTWGGVAMHAGQLPGYPASHGCVRLPYDFAQKLYTITTKGTTVIVTDGKDSKKTLDVTSRPGLLLSGKLAQEEPPQDSGSFTWKPEKSPEGPVSIIFSSADQQAYVFRNGVEIGRAYVSGTNQFTGSHAFSALNKVNDDGTHDWNALGSADGSDAPNLKTLAKHLAIPPDFRAKVRAVIQPGSTLILTDQPVNRSTKSAPGFKILTTENNSK